jgi:signal transduction histidine kinase
MDEPGLEPGLLSVFRLFAGLQFGLLCLVAAAFALEGGNAPHPVSAVVAMAATSGVLLVLLFLERAYLPVALALAWAVPLAGQSVLLGGAFSEYSVLAAEASAFLLVPLLVISWQYAFRWAAFFALGAALIDLGLIGIAFDPAFSGVSGLLRLVILRPAGFLAVGFLVTRLMRGQREQRAALAHANETLRRHADTQERLVVSRERNRLAREVHDTLSHTLTGMAVQLEAVRALWDDQPDESRRMTEAALETARSGAHETRRAVAALRARPLDDLGITLAVQDLAESMAGRAGWTLELTLESDLGLVSPEVEQAVYRVVQEALVNAARHADARRVHVALSRRDEQLILSVTDDGRGFDPAAVDGVEHFGLRGMRERAAALHGTLTVDCSSGRGTRVKMTVPA